MRIRIFRAPTLSSAMAQIRRELGADALILSERGREGFVEVTAALEAVQTVELRSSSSLKRRPAIDKLPGIDDLEPFQAEATAPAGSRSERPQGDIIPAGSLSEALIWHGLTPVLIEALCCNPLEKACARAFQFQPISFAGEAPPLLFAGPAGAGKTLTVARLATRLVLSGQTPLVVTTDAQRAGAVEQLAAFTRLLGLTLVAASTPVTLARALTRRVTGQPVLIDAPGLDLEDPSQSDLLRSLVSASGAAPVLVLPCGLDPSEAQDIGCAHAGIGAQTLIATRTDASRRMGGILCAASAANLALSEAGIGSAAADGLVAMTPAFLADRLRRAGRDCIRPTPTQRRSNDSDPRAPETATALFRHIAAQQRAASRS